MGKLVLVLGGARSGKSTFAEKLAQKIGDKDVIYVATAGCHDEEMAKRIEIHQKSRPQEWLTIEETKKVANVILQQGNNSKVILLDCLTLLTTNLLLDEGIEPDLSKEEIIANEVKAIALNSKQVSADVIVVSNEVGLGLVPTYPLGREYRDVAGRANQLIASFADEVYFAIAGIPVEIKALAKKLEGENNNG